MRNKGDGTFDHPSTSSDGGSSSTDIAVGDYDGDGFLDIMRGEWFNGAVLDQFVINYNRPLGELSLANTDWTLYAPIQPLTVLVTQSFWFRLKNSDGNFYGETPADLTATPAAGGLFQNTDTKMQGAFYVPTFNSTVSGDQFITLASGDNELQIPYNFAPGTAFRTQTLISSDKDEILADGQSTAVITVQTRDQYGNNLISGGSAIVLATTLGALGDVADNGDGTYTATLTAGNQVGNATITGTLNGAAITDNATVAMQAAAAAAATTTITADPIAITADGQSTSTITVQAKDANGNNLAAGGDAVVLATTLGVLGAVADNGDGTYTATLTAGVVAGTATVTGTINGAAITDDADVALNVGAAAAATTTITANPIAITADGQSTSTITVQAKDANGNNLAAGGDAVVLATTLGALGAVADNGDGTYTATLTAGVVAGTATITGTINGAAITDDADVAFNVGAAAAATTTITANPIAITADGQSTSTITVQAKDANGNNLAAGGDAVVLATTLGALGAVADNNDGTYTATLTAGVVAGTATITGTINGAAITDDADVAFNVGAAAAATTTITANPIAITADGQSTSTITVQAKDANGNNLQGGGDAVVLATTLGALGAVADNGDGTYTATLTAGVVAGTATITGTINGAAITDDADVAFNVGAAAAAATTITANPIAITADGQSTSTITVQAKDANGNNPAGGDAVVLATTLGAQAR